MTGDPNADYTELPDDLPVDDAPEGAVDRPELLGDQANSADERERKAREDLGKRRAVEDGEFLRGILRDPAGRRFVWSILQACGTFEEKYGFGPLGHPHAEATWAYRGQKDLGLRFYHSWSVIDRAGILQVLDENHPQFPKES